MLVHPFDHLATEIRKAGGDLTERELVGAMLANMSKEQKEQFYSDSCYYYESREGPYDWLIERAETFGIILWDQTTGCWRLGPIGNLYGRSIWRHRFVRS